MDDPQPKIDRVLRFVETYNPKASSVLELGCGSGTILAGLGRFATLSGVDISPEMLAIARDKAPSAQLIEGDITDFELGERFDVVICVFDTLNHITSFDGWRALFACAHRHLEPGGLFVFDVNTAAKLHGLATYPPWWTQAPGGWVIQNVDPPRGGVSRWNVWIVERLPDGSLAGQHERIGELAVALPAIEVALQPAFELLEIEDETGHEPDARSERVHFALRACE